jgi:DNA-binding MarR family transcriptional regulator
LVVLDREGGRLTMGQLADVLLIQPSTATRLCDRLVARRLVRRRVDPRNRREVRVELTASGQRIVDDVSARRRVEITSIMASVPLAQRRTIVEALQAFSDAAGEPPSDHGLPW